MSVEETKEPAKSPLRSPNDLLASISRAQSLFITDAAPSALFEGLLDDLLSLTQSGYGFIGEVLYTEAGKPYLKTHAITNIAWDEESRRFYEEHAREGMEFHNLQTLFGAVMTSCQPVIANEPAADPRGGGLPEGHPALQAFLGLPFFHGQKMVGMVGIANRPGGYDHQTIDYLQPLLKTCANIVVANRSDRQRKRTEEALKLIVRGTSSVVGKQFFRNLVRNLAEAVGVRWAFIAELADRKRESVKIIARWDGAGYQEDLTYKVKGTPCETVMGEQPTFYSDRLQERFPRDEWLKAHGVQSYLAVALFDSAGNPLGHMGVMHHGRMTDLFDESVVKIFAARAGAELERMRADDRLRKREQQQKVASEVGQACLRTGDLNDVMNLAVERIAGVLGVELCKVLLLNEAGDSLLLAAGVGWKEGWVGKATVSVGSHSQAGYTLKMNGPVIVEDVGREVRFESPPLLRQHAAVSGLSVPMVSRGRSIGVLGAHSTRLRTFTQEDAEFLQTIANLMAVAIDRRRAEEALTEEAIRDSLTGLYNRRYFNQRIVEEIAVANRNRYGLSVLLCDLDRFKAVNDTLGHQAGDRILKEVAKCIQDATRGADLVFRWGGDEFLVILSNARRPGILVAAERIRKGIRELCQKSQIDIDASVGVALFPEHGNEPEQLIHMADKALYIAKKGGSGIHIGEEEFPLDEHAVKIVFQPVIDTRSNQLLGYEALSRDPHGRLTILELFKRYQAVGQLTELKCLCFKLQLKKAREVGLNRVFINIDLNVLRRLEPVACPPDIEAVLEISENEAIFDVGKSLELIGKWRARGFKFGIDDFGAGFISLPFIAQLIPDYIKLDRSTIVQAASSEQFGLFLKDLVRAIQNYSREGIIAEGVENEKEFQTVSNLGAYLVQGFLLGKPQELN